MSIDDFTITVPLASPEMRDALRSIAVSFQLAEEAIGPSGSGGGRSQNKPSSRPPSGNHEAAHVCHQLVRDSKRIHARVERLYREMDPQERKNARDWHDTVKRMRKETREARGDIGAVAHLMGGRDDVA